MSLLYSLEERFPRFGIPGLVRYICVGMLLVFGLDMMRVLPIETWVLQMAAVLHGQVWRVVTFLFVPLSANPFFLLLELMLLVMVGDGLERAWGSFRVTVYYLIGVAAALVTALLVPSMVVAGNYLNLSLFLAYATIYPDAEILIFFVIPVKMRYLAYIYAFFLLWSLATAPWYAKVLILLSIANYLLFFGQNLWRSMRDGAKSYERRRKMEESFKRGDEARNTCTICGRTELTDPNLEFRYCTCKQCGESGKAFCIEHLSIHKGNRMN
jgi:hypothetical protein